MNLELCQLWIPGEPVAQPRPRSTKRGHVYNPPTADAWKARIKSAARALFPDTEPMQGPLRIDWVFYFERPKYLLKPAFSKLPIWKPTKPDKDNLEKAGLDALTSAGLIADDAIVVAGDVRKYWCAIGRGPGAWVRVVPVAENTEEQKGGA